MRKGGSPRAFELVYVGSLMYLPVTLTTARHSTVAQEDHRARCVKSGALGRAARHPLWFKARSIHLRRMFFLLDSQGCPWSFLSQFQDWAQKVSAILLLRTGLKNQGP